MKKDLIIIYVKRPVKGFVKTRLAIDIGDTKALEVYKKLLKITHKAVKGTTFEKWVHYAGEVEENDLWDDINPVKTKQKGTDLGERMFNSFDLGFSKGQERIVLIGSDCPFISPEILNESIAALKRNDCVIGPANDGGYYLIGMNKPLPFLFEDKPWSTAKLFEATIAQLKEKNIKYSLLPTLGDIDTIEDLKAWQQVQTTN